MTRIPRFTDADRPGPTGELTPRREADWLPTFFTAASFPVPPDKRPATPVPCPFAHRQTVVSREAAGTEHISIDEDGTEHISVVAEDTEHIMVTCDWLAQRTGAPSGVTDGICEKCMRAGLPANDHPVLEHHLTEHMLARLADGDRPGRYADRPIADAIATLLRRGVERPRIFHRLSLAATLGYLAPARLREVMGQMGADQVSRAEKTEVLVSLVSRNRRPAATVEAIRADVGVDDGRP